MYLSSLREPFGNVLNIEQQSSYLIQKEKEKYGVRLCHLVLLYPTKVSPAPRYTHAMLLVTSRTGLPWECSAVTAVVWTAPQPAERGVVCYRKVVA